VPRTPEMPTPYSHNSVQRSGTVASRSPILMKLVVSVHLHLHFIIHSLRPFYLCLSPFLCRHSYAPIFCKIGRERRPSEKPDCQVASSDSIFGVLANATSHARSASISSVMIDYLWYEQGALWVSDMLNDPHFSASRPSRVRFGVGLRSIHC